jgi:hypothetical protein
MINVQWVEFYTLTYSHHRNPVLLPTVLSAEWIRVEFSFVRQRPKDSWFRAGWLSQVHQIGGRPHQRSSLVVPLGSSVFQFDSSPSYQLRFQPVPWLPECSVRFIRSL